MKQALKGLKQFLLAGCFFGGCLFFTNCSTNKKIVKIKNWVDWDIEFKKNESSAERYKIANEADRYILGYIDSTGIKIAALKITHDFSPGKVRIKVATSIDSTDAAATIPPPKRLPS